MEICGFKYHSLVLQKKKTTRERKVICPSWRTDSKKWDRASGHLYLTFFGFASKTFFNRIELLSGIPWEGGNAVFVLQSCSEVTKMRCVRHWCSEPVQHHQLKTSDELYEQQSLPKCPWNMRECSLCSACRETPRSESCDIGASVRSRTRASPQILSLKVLGFHSSLCNFAGHFCWFVGFFPRTILSYIFAVSSSHCIPDRAVAPHSLQDWVSSISSCLTFDCHLPLSSLGWCAACNTCNPQNLPFSSTQNFAMGRGYNLEILMKKQQGGIKQTLLLHFDNSEGKLPPGIILLSKSCGGADGQDGNLSCHCSWLRSCLVTFLLCKHLRGNQRMHCSQVRSILHLNT